MDSFVLDSFALLAYFKNERGAEIVEQLLNEALQDKKKLFLTNINAGEIYYIAYRKDGFEKAGFVWKAIQEFPISLIEANMALTFKAATLKAKYKLSYADAFAAALAIDKKATLITGDNEFDNLKNEQNFKMKYL